MASNNGSRKRTTKSTRNTGSRNSSTRSKTTRTRNAKAVEPMDTALRNEIILIALCALCIVLFLCNFGIIGPIGSAISSVMFGILGLIAYVFPIVLFLAIAFGISNIGSVIATRKLLASAILCLCLMIVFELFSAHLSKDVLYNAKDIYERCGGEHVGGGIIGGTIAWLMIHFIGWGGTVLALIVLIIISAVIITDKSFLTGVSHHGKKMVEKSKEDAEYRREQRERWIENQEVQREKARQRKLEREERLAKERELKEQQQKAREEEKQLKKEERENEKILRMDKKVSGVMINTSLDKVDEVQDKAKNRDDIHEIMLDTIDEDIETRINVGINDDENNAEISNDVLPEVPVSQYNLNLDKKDSVHEITLDQMDSSRIEPIVETNVISKTYDLPDFSKKIEEKHSQIQELNPDKVDDILNPVMDIPNPPKKNYEFQGSPIIKKEGMTLGIDNAFCGEGADNKPEASFQNTMGNQMASNIGVNRVKAVPKSKDDETPNHLTYENKNENIGAAYQNQVLNDSINLQSGNSQMEQMQENVSEPVCETQPVFVPKPYELPPLDLLTPAKKSNKGDSENELRETAELLRQTLSTFGVNVTITEISQGPAVTRYEMQPEQGVKVNKIVNLADDIKLNLAATDIRIEAPIPGKRAVGIEVPNRENSAVSLRELLESDAFQNFEPKLAFAVGKDIGGQTVVTDIAKMPHMLIAGSTGSGKSVCINTIIMSVLYKANPDEVKLILVDPKVVELSVYNGIPHLLIPVVTDPKKASSALHWAVNEMTERYKKFADYNVRDLKGFNRLANEMWENGEPGAPEKMPQILIIVDELADLMMVAPGEVEESICRLAQLARAAGIHLIIATQRPSVDVITGLIKANMPSRVAFAVSSGVDSRTILDMVGAEKLLGKGDMLFYPQGYTKPARVQGAFVSDQEVSNVVNFIKQQAYNSNYGQDVEEKLNSMSSENSSGNVSKGQAEGANGYDQLFVEAGQFIIEKDRASIGMLQRAFKIGFNRAARIMDQLCEAGVVGEEEGTKPRKILMSMEQFESLLEQLG